MHLGDWGVGPFGRPNQIYNKYHAQMLTAHCGRADMTLPVT